jgi:hypothetical protein
MNSPGTNPRVINDLFPGVQEALFGKDITPQQSAIWVRKTLEDLTAKYPFEELRIKGPMVTIGPGLGNQGSNYEYPVMQFLNAGDDLTLMENPVIFLSPTQAQQVNLVGTGMNFGTSPVGYPMDYMTPTAIQSQLFIPGGIPFHWTRYGQYFWFGTQPGQPFQTYLPYQRRHPFQDANLPQSPLFIPPDWQDIVEYAAAVRGAQSLRWPEQVKWLREILYGDPKNPQGRPGLLTAQDLQIERDQQKSSRQLMPIVARY